MTTVIAGKSGMFGPMKERKAQRKAAPYAVYAIEGRKYWFSLHNTAKDAVQKAKDYASYKGFEFQDRTEEA